MIKSLFNRAQLKADQAAEAVRDPNADAHAALQNIRKQKTEMVEVRKNILIATRTAQSRKAQAEAEVARYEGLAKLAGNAKNIEDVKLALTKKAAAEQKAKDAANEVGKLSAQEDGLEAKIAEFDLLIEKAENDREYLSTQLQINQFNAQVNNVLKSSDGARSAISRLSDDVERSRIEAEVSGELSDDSTSLEARYKPANGVTDEDVNKYLTA